jgi:hypothetical protein
LSATAVKAGAAVGFLLLATMIVLLVMQLVVLRNSNDRIVAQDAKATALLESTRPLVKDARPFIKDARGLVKPIREQGGQIVRATDVLPGLALAARELISDLAPLIDDLAPLMGTVERSARDVERSRQIVEESLAIQRRTLKAQLAGLRLQRAALRVARATLAHAESIDRKTGGSLPTP